MEADFFFVSIASIIIPILLCSLFKKNPRNKDLTGLQTKDSSTVQNTSIVHTGFSGLESDHWGCFDGGKGRTWKDPALWHLAGDD